MIDRREAEVNKSPIPFALSAADLADRFRVSLRHIRRMDSSGKLPRPIKLGASVRWPVAEIEAWLAAGAPDRRTWEQRKGVQR